MYLRLPNGPGDSGAARLSRSAGPRRPGRQGAAPRPPASAPGRAATRPAPARARGGPGCRGPAGSQGRASPEARARSSLVRHLAALDETPLAAELDLEPTGTVDRDRVALGAVDGDPAPAEEVARAEVPVDPVEAVLP